jgi:ankyrin repeat protein
MTICAGNHDVMKLLVERITVTDIQNIRGNTALILASSHGYDRVVKALLEKNADSDIQRNSFD